jgi:predicted peptidase
MQSCTRPCVALLVAFVLGLSGLTAAGQAPVPPASAPGSPPSDPVVVSLPEKAKLPSSPGYFAVQAQVTAGQQQFPMSFTLFLPPGYFRSNEPFPMIITLHNKHLMGLGGQWLDSEGMAALWVRDEWDTRYPTTMPSQSLNLRKSARFVGIAPQCPAGRFFENPPMPQVISELATQISKVYGTDDDRVYLTGFSYGGTATWQVAEQLPRRFAAIVPLSARATADPAKTVQTLKDVPIYLGCGTKEWALPFCRQMHEALKAGGHPNFISRIIPDGTHWCYPAIYTDPQFMDWLLAQKRKR